MNSNITLKLEAYTKKYFNIIIGIIIFSVLVIIFNNEIIKLHYSINIFCSTFGISLGLISLVRKSNSYYKFLGIGFLFIGFLEYFSILIRICDISNSLLFLIIWVNKILEVIVIFIAIIMYLKQISNVQAICGYTALIALLMCGTKYFLYHIKNGIVCNNYYIFCFIITIITIIFLGKIKKNTQVKNMYIYMVFILIYQILSVKIYIDEKYISLIGDILRCLAYFEVYNGIKKYILKFQYDNMKEKLLTIQNKQRELNTKLREKSIILQELNAINKNSEERYCNLIESFKDGLAIFNRGRLIYANDDLLSKINISDKELLIGMKIETLIESIESQDYIKNRVLSSDYVNPNKNIKVVYRFNKFSDKLKELEFYLVDYGINNQIVYIREITEINKYNKVAKIYDSYLKEDEIKSEFYSNISHELRTPINIIHSALTVNEMYLNENNLESLKKNNNVIKQNCLRLIRTINNFIDANKASEGYLKANKKIYNLVEIVENITSATKRYVEKINNSLVFDSVCEEIYIPIDVDMLERIILNIISNSVKYGKKNKELKVNIYTNKKCVYIIIKNYTTAIDKENEKYIFDKFTSVNKSLNRKKEGSGLGLFLSKEMVELHGGKISFKSNKKNGNRFIIELPIESNLKKYPIGDDFEIVTLEKKVDIEFSDIYI